MSWLPWTRETKQKIDRAQSLKAIPVLNNDVEAREVSDGRLVITVKHKPVRKGWAAVLSPKVDYRKIKLDELGTFTFGLIDGSRTVLEIIDIFQKQFKTNRREAELSCVEFMKLLASRYIISLVIK